MKSALPIISALCLLGSAAAFADEKTAGDMVDDNWIHAKAETALVGHGTFNVNIEVHQGTVQIAGFVESESQRNEAEKAVAGVEGVRDISNKLVVQASERGADSSVDDGMVTARVKAGLTSNDNTSGFDINVETRNGVVLLSGFVQSDEQRQQAIQIARDVDGVMDVINGMDVIS